MSDRNASETQPKPGAKADAAPAEATVAATDELFQQQPPVVPDPKATEEPAATASLGEDNEPPNWPDAPEHNAAVPDYVRELQLEFEEQQEEGKL